MEMDTERGKKNPFMVLAHPAFRVYFLYMQDSLALHQKFAQCQKGGCSKLLFVCSQVQIEQTLSCHTRPLWRLWPAAASGACDNW